MSGEEYKPIHTGAKKSPEAASEIATLHAEVSNISADLSKFRDPVIQGSLLFKLQQERENSNRLLKSILDTLETRLARMEERIGEMERKMGATPQAASSAPHTSAISQNSAEDLLLPSVDSDIVSFIRSKGTVCAEDVRVHFRYKGKNAASSRLNHLFELGVLEKRQAGRVVYYKMRQ